MHFRYVAKESFKYTCFLLDFITASMPEISKGYSSVSLFPVEFKGKGIALGIGPNQEITGGTILKL